MILMIDTSFCVGENSFAGMTHTPHCSKMLWFMCTMFIRYCSAPLRLLQTFLKNTSRVNSHGEQRVPLPISCDLCDFCLNIHEDWTSQRKSCNAHPLFPIAVMWEGYWLTKLWKNCRTSLMEGDCFYGYWTHSLRQKKVQIIKMLFCMTAFIIL